MSAIPAILSHLTQTEHGFKHIIAAGDDLLRDESFNHFDVAQQLIKHETYQGRMLGTYLLGDIAARNPSAFDLLKTTVSRDDNWRVQEMLAKAFDQYAKAIGYEKALPDINDWLSNSNPNVVRAVIEGLRIWTSRPYFKENPGAAVSLIGQHRAHESEYVRKSIGNALRDIRRKYSDIVKQETENWDIANPRILFTHKLVYK